MSNRFAETQSLEELVYQAVGAASMCWVGGTAAALQAKYIGDELIEVLQERFIDKNLLKEIEVHAEAYNVTDKISLPKDDYTFYAIDHKG